MTHNKCGIFCTFNFGGYYLTHFLMLSLSLLLLLLGCLLSGKAAHILCISITAVISGCIFLASAQHQGNIHANVVRGEIDSDALYSLLSVWLSKEISAI